MVLSRREVLGSFVALGATSLFSPAIRSETKPTYRVVVIGHTGRGNYGHGIDQIWHSVPETQLTAVADPNEQGRAKAIDRLKIPTASAFADYRVMLEELRPEIVAIGPRHVDQHCEMALAAVRSGAKGIYIEKPFVRDLVEADQIVGTCKTAHTKLAIAHRNRYHPVLPVIRELVKDGVIGRLLEIRLRGKEDQRGGLLDLWVLGSHLLNLALYFAGPATACTAGIYQDGRPVTRDDLTEGAEGVGPIAGNEVHARYETASGVPIYFDSIQGAGTREAGFGLQLIGNGGIIDLRADREPLAHICLGNPHRPDREGRSWIPLTSAGIGKPEPTANIQQLVAGHLGPVQDLLASIENDRAPLCSATDGRAVVEMTMAVYASHRDSGKRVDLPLHDRLHPFTKW